MLIADSAVVKLINSQEILIGIGNKLKLVKKKNGKINIQFAETGFRSKILGIEILNQDQNSLILVYGGRYLAAFAIIGGILKKLSGCRFPDFVSSIHSQNDPENICLVTGHNIAILLNFKETFSIQKKAKCEDNSTLYCSHVEGKTWEDFVVYSGTALGDVIIWKPSKANEAILYRFTAHKGVVFSIKTSGSLLVTTSDDRSAKIWNKKDRNAVIPLASLYGHTARVFKSKIIQKNDQNFILTIGEDSNLCVWNFSGQFMFRKALHNGATIWNLDYDDTRETVYTVGSDGNARKIILRKILSSDPQSKSLLEEKISKILFLDTERIFALTSEMVLLQKDLKGCWKKSVRENLPEMYVSLIENVLGKILICSNAEVRIYKITNHTIELEHRNENLLKGLIRTFYLISRAEFFFVDDQGNCAITDSSLKIQNQFSVSICQNYWSTKWITVAKKISGFFLFGDRVGHLHLCEISPGRIEIIQTVKNVHGNLGITEIFVERESEDFAAFWTSGRDGILRKFIINPKTCSLREVFTEKVPISWVEKIVPLGNGRKMILGFNSENLIVWERDEGVIFQLSTGGGHKFWDFIVNPDGTSASVLSVTDKRPNMSEFDLPYQNDYVDLNIPIENWHFKSCNSMEAFRDSSGRILLCSGGDDNILRLNFLEESSLTSLSEVITHISNIRSVKIIDNPEGFLLISVGGRAQMCITGVILRRESPEIEEHINYMLKPRDLRKNRLNQMIDFCPETRFMCLSVDEKDIFVGCSDGFLRHFRLENDQIHLITSVSYGRCILNIQLIKTSQGKILLTMGSDGKIIFWNAEDLSEDSLPIYSITHHDSGINCFDLWQEDMDIVLITGGDDQKITKSIFHLGQNKITLKETPQTAFLHFAQVTGIKIVSKNEFFSTSVDQRVFRVHMNDFKVIDECFTSVSDLKGIILLNETSVIVYGSGMELLKF
ncbi:uncharacterized protein DMENIID0001_158100 [Sergentomyia squamirostris]